MSARLLDIGPDEYHRHPGFSASVAKVLIAKSPLHAKHARGKTPTKAMEFGDAGHRFLLGKGKEIKPVPFDNYNVKDARKTRDDYRKAGFVPLLADDYDAAEKLAEAAKKRLIEEHERDHRIPAVLDGVSEQAMEWTEDTSAGPLLCRGMMDHVWVDRGLILDIKFTEDASPRAIERTAENLGYAIQSAAYTRGLAKIRPELEGRIRFLFMFIEMSPPHAMNIVEPDGVFREIGERRWRRAVDTWARCTKENDWPAYGHGINRISSPQWALNNEGSEYHGF